MSCDDGIMGVGNNISGLREILNLFYSNIARSREIIFIYIFLYIRMGVASIFHSPRATGV